MTCSVSDPSPTTAAREFPTSDPLHADLDFVRNTILENHPGMYDSLNPDFQSQFAENYAQTLEQLKQSDTKEEKTRALTDFAKRFCDSHLWIRYASPSSTSAPIAKQAFSIQILPNNCIWITIPTFEPSAEQSAQLQAIIESLPEFRGKKIVFDLRGNGGGNSSLSNEILNSLCGKEYTQACCRKLFRNVYVEWRASSGNLEFMKQKLDRRLQSEFEPNDPARKCAEQQVEAFYTGMQKAIDAHLEYYKMPNTSALDEEKSHQNAFQGKIIAIIDRECTSACLDFLDRLKTVQPNACFVGETTNADSVYMELREVSLPSGQGKFGFPIKVYRNRPRGHNIPHVPHIRYQGNLNDTDMLQKFVTQQHFESL